jgi:hypothetical protein
LSVTQLERRPALRPRLHEQRLLRGHKAIEDRDGGAEGDRTPDLRIANAALSQLSYGPDSPE